MNNYVPTDGTIEMLANDKMKHIPAHRSNAGNGLAHADTYVRTALIEFGTLIRNMANDRLKAEQLASPPAQGAEQEREEASRIVHEWSTQGHADAYAVLSDRIASALARARQVPPGHCLYNGAVRKVLHIDNNALNEPVNEEYYLKLPPRADVVILEAAALAARGAT